MPTKLESQEPTKVRSILVSYFIHLRFNINGSNFCTNKFNERFVRVCFLYIKRPVNVKSHKSVKLSNQLKYGFFKKLCNQNIEETLFYIEWVKWAIDQRFILKEITFFKNPYFKIDRHFSPEGRRDPLSYPWVWPSFIDD